MNFSILFLLAQLATGQVSPLAPGGRLNVPLGEVVAGETYRLQANLEGPIRDRDRIQVTLEGPGGWRTSKALHAGDPDLYLPFRPSAGGEATLAIESSEGSGQLSVRTSWTRLELRSGDSLAIEAEPNDSWRQANPLKIGRAVYGSADDVDYLENLDEGKAGLDWFRFEVSDESPVLVYFQLELLDRDVSANLRVHRLDPASGEVRPYESGKDPTEIVHDRERERYSTHLSRTFTKGIYFVEVNANHPDYILRTRSYQVPPLTDPSKAVEAGIDYLLEVGDAWFAQIPREGNIFVRSGNLHDTSTRCTACHASSFPTEASLVGLANGYPIRAKSSMLYLMDRLTNSPTPLYGDDGLYWQRFIAIPLQAQGKQGGIVLDFENQVLGRQTPEFARFGPFLQAAWRGRRSLPADEVNGVVPLDSKFGLAWRDWRVLNEMMRRTGRIAYAQAADAIADILDDPDTDRQVETLQDRIHRLYAWWLIDKVHFADRIKAEADALLARQNPDGGWHELDRKPGPTAVYTTGQLTWTLLKLGYRRDDPRIARALTYLLAQQQPFGGWFQTTTHENFRTPMRETRYAVEALAEAFPRTGGPQKGWVNRDGQPPWLPGMASPIVAFLDDLDNFWEVPETGRISYSRAVARLLDHPEPLVKAHAAACLGRIGDPSAVEPLVARLGDPSKIVWRAAAWSLRRLANQGHGIEAIKGALLSPAPATRRGAVRVFAYQFSGIDGRLDLADLLIERSGDPDLWTRLQAIRSLRQWFYRSNDAAFRRRVVDAYLARMAEPDEPVVRKALSEGMYILLDENLGGGVSLQKNLAALPEKFRRNALEGRKAVERDVLLGPILSAMESGNALQREALVRSFDGSFFKGRTYARQPSGMLDVGNDREFGFLYDPPLEQLDRTFAALLTSDSTSEVRRRSIQIASFFQVPARSTNGRIQSALLKGLTDLDPGVRDAAKALMGNDLELRGAEDDPGRLALIQGLLFGDGDDRKAVVRAIARNRALLAKPEILERLRAMLNDADPRSLLPVLGNPTFSDADVLSAVNRAWPFSSDAADRLELLDVLISRPGLIDVDEPRSGASEVLRLAVVDRTERVREKALGAIERMRNRKLAERLLLSSLADDSPSLRRQALTLASSRESFWTKPEALERLLALLVDSDAKVRDQALAIVERLSLARNVPAVARRVKALADDPSLKARAEACLEMQGFKPNSIEPDVKLGSPRLLSLSTFRDKVNPLFYQAGDDGHSCVRCHANHGVLRIGEAGAVDSLVVNYKSALKVINLGDPEASLLLRKPRSPLGQGAPDEASPTGLTHVGGPRWDGIDHPAYRAILNWIRETSEEAGVDAPFNPGPRPEARP
jgi:cellulose synthase operon protein C